MSVQITLSPETIQAVIQQYFAATRSLNKAESMVVCFAEDTISYDPVGTPALKGHTQLREFFQGIAALFAEVELFEDFTSINGNEAAVKWTGRGIGQNGRSVTFEGIDLFEFNNEGKIQSLRAYWNPSAMLAQLQG
jgi:steroid Delta-isomerase